LGRPTTAGVFDEQQEELERWRVLLLVSDADIGRLLSAVRGAGRVRLRVRPEAFVGRVPTGMMLAADWRAYDRI
jgi:hypothetical protein